MTPPNTESVRCVGVCQTDNDWGPDDVLGLLLVKEHDGWVVAASHISSNSSFSRLDIGRHASRLGLTMEWAGSMSSDEILAAYPPAHIDGSGVDR